MANKKQQQTKKSTNVVEPVVVITEEIKIEMEKVSSRLEELKAEKHKIEEEVLKLKSSYQEELIRQKQQISEQCLVEQNRFNLLREQIKQLESDFKLTKDTAYEFSENLRNQAKVEYNQMKKKGEEEYSQYKTEAKKILSDAEAEAHKIKLEGKQDIIQLQESLKKETKDHKEKLDNDLNKKLQKINDQQIILKQQNEEYNKKEKEIIEKEKTLFIREENIRLREEEASNGFSKQFHEQLKNYKINQSKLEKDLNDIEMQKVNREKEIKEELALFKKTIYDEVKKYKEDEEKKITLEKEALTTTKKALNNLEISLTREKERLEFELNECRELKQEYLDQLSGLEERVKQKVDHYNIDLNNYNQSLKDAIKKVSEENNRLNAERIDLIERIKKNGLKDKDDLLNQINDQEKIISELKKLSDNLKEKILNEGDRSKFELLKKKSDEYDLVINELKIEKSRRIDLELKLNRIGSESELLEAERKTSNEFKEQRDKYLNELEKLRKVDRNDRISSIVEVPVEFFKFRNVTKDLGVFEEINWLEQIRKKAENSGIYFSQRLINAYHTAVKTSEWSPMVVLAGVSGTGKSELPRQYAIHGGMCFLSIPVKPDWDSPNSLFGYYNSIENKFEPTELLRALYQMQSSMNNEFKNRMLMVLLDEMNLAHVELYFSDLLSKFETRRGTGEDAKYEISLGAGERAEILNIGKNILWTGTMNEDETTKALSDKVIDRSTLITFPRPDDLKSRGKNGEIKPSFYITRTTWNKWVNDSVNPWEIDKNLMDKFKEVVQSINKTMSKMGRNLGHRVWQGIENYIGNYPNLIDFKRNNNKTVSAEVLMKQAFSEAVAFKVMPKLRGLETQGDYEDFLNEIAEKIDQNISELSGDFKHARNLPSRIFQWCSADFLKKD